MKKQNRSLNNRIKKAGLGLEQGGNDVEMQKEKSVKEVVEETKKSLELGAQEKEANKIGVKIADALGLGQPNKKESEETVEEKKEYVFCIAECVPNMIISSTTGGEELELAGNEFLNRILNRIVKKSRSLLGMSLYKAHFKRAVVRLLEDIQKGELRIFSEDGFIYSSYKGAEPKLLIGSGNLLKGDEEFEDFDTAQKPRIFASGISDTPMKSFDFLDLL